MNAELHIKLAVDHAVHTALNERPSLTKRDIAALEREVRQAEIARQEELQRLVAEQQADDTFYVDRPAGEISLDAPAPSGEGTIGDLIGYGEDGEQICLLPPGFDHGNVVTHDKPGPPEVRSKPQTPLTRSMIRSAIASRIVALRAIDVSLSWREAHRLAVGESPAAPHAVVKALGRHGESALGTEAESRARKIRRWKRDVRSIPRYLGRTPSWALKAPSSIPEKYTGEREGGSDGPYSSPELIRYQINDLGRAFRTPVEIDLMPPTTNPRTLTKRMYADDANPVPDDQRSAAPA